MKSVQIALLLALFFSAALTADARPSKSSSFKSGFSSQKASPARSSGSFGSFGPRQSQPARAPEAAPASRSGGFGSFSNAAGNGAQRSDSSLSQGLDKGAAQANAIRTLEARRRAEQDAMNAAARPVPSGPLPHNERVANRDGDLTRGQHYPMQAPVIIQQQGSSGIGNMITGFLLAKATTPTRASANGYPAQPGAVPASGSSFFTSMLRTFAWLLILTVIGWSAYFAWKFLRRGKAPSQANYSFER